MLRARAAAARGEQQAQRRRAGGARRAGEPLEAEAGAALGAGACYGGGGPADGVMGAAFEPGMDDGCGDLDDYYGGAQAICLRPAICHGSNRGCHRVQRQVRCLVYASRSCRTGWLDRAHRLSGHRSLWA